MFRILIIDDDPDIVEAMQVVLESENYEVVSAKNGKEGLKKIKANPPDLVILDVMMDEVDEGFQVARKIKAEKYSQNIPILMVTAIKEKTGLDFKESAGDKNWLPVDDFCEKPLKPEDLLAKVKKMIRV